MNILLNDQSVAIFFGPYAVHADCVEVGPNMFNWEHHAGNTTLIEAELPEPALPHLWKWQDNAWVCIDQATLDAQLQAEKDAFNAAQEKRRAAAYAAEADPLFFKAQRGDVSLQDWLAKVNEIKARFAYRE